MVALVKKVAKVFRPRAQKEGLNIKTDIPDSPMIVHVDEDRMIQVLTNLIMNAIKFTSSGSVQVTLRDKNSEIECSVTDTGVGLSPKDLKQVFNKFQQFGHGHGGEKGTGLGLSISKSLVELHGGTISVKSKFGEGTTFSFTIPKN